MKSSNRLCVWAAACAGAILVGIIAWASIAFVVGMSRHIEQKQRFILYNLNHRALANIVKDFAWPDSTRSLDQGLKDKDFEYPNSEIPDALWVAEPARISFRENRVDFEYGGGMLHFGISIFPNGEVGDGTLELEKGVWFYSENGRYPQK